MRAVLMATLVACGAPAASSQVAPPPPSSHAPPAPPVPPSAPDPRAGCMVQVQPAAPGHTSVEPADMICTHGDAALACKADFDGARSGCSHAQPGAVAAARGDLQAAIAEGRLWCCPPAR